jgi:hypothetical protein
VGDRFKVVSAFVTSSFSSLLRYELAYSSKLQSFSTSASSAKIPSADFFFFIGIGIDEIFCFSSSLPLSLDDEFLENIPLIFSVVLLPVIGDLRPLVEEEEFEEVAEVVDLGLVPVIPPSLLVLPADDLRSISGLDG